MIKKLIDELPEENNPDEIFDRINDISPDIVDLIDIQQQRINDRSTSTSVSGISETVIIERTVVFIDTDVNNVTLAAKAAKEPIFTLHASNQFVNESTIAQMFPHLFPYGRGHPNETKRRIKISPFKCAEHYLMLSSRRFTQDRYFTLAIFDQLSMQNAYTRVYVRAKQFPTIYNNYDKVELNEVDNALKRKELRRRGRMNSMSTISSEKTDESKKADALLKSVDLSS